MSNRFVFSGSMEKYFIITAWEDLWERFCVDAAIADVHVLEIKNYYSFDSKF